MHAPFVSRFALWLGLGYAVAACNPEGSGQSTAEKTKSPAATDPNAPPSEEEPVASPGPGPSGEPGTKPNNGEPPGTPPGTPPAFDLYDPDTVPHFELTIDAAAMAVLSNTSTDPLDEKEWVHASFKMGANTFADVGLRRKGSSTFRALPGKSSFKVKFNKWVKGQKLYGLEALTLNNMVSDSSFVGERLTYHVFRSLGLPAERANTALVTLNGESYGIYANVETPDERFLDRVFGKDQWKTLYEVDSGSEWQPNYKSGFKIDIADPTAPIGTRPDADKLFAAVLASSDAELLTKMAPYLHTTKWFRFAAAEAITGCHDGYAYGIYGSHNYFMAGGVDGKFSLIPWSTDLSHVEKAGMYSAAAPRPNTVLARCSRDTACWNAYRAEVQSVLDVYATLDLVNLAKKWHQQLDPLVLADKKKEAKDSRYAERKALLYPWLEARPGVIKAQLGL